MRKITRVIKTEECEILYINKKNASNIECQTFRVAKIGMAEEKILAAFEKANPEYKGIKVKNRIITEKGYWISEEDFITHGTEFTEEEYAKRAALITANRKKRKNVN